MPEQQAEVKCLTVGGEQISYQEAGRRLHVHVGSGWTDSAVFRFYSILLSTDSWQNALLTEIDQNVAAALDIIVATVFDAKKNNNYREAGELIKIAHAACERQMFAYFKRNNITSHDIRR